MAVVSKLKTRVVKRVTRTKRNKASIAKKFVKQQFKREIAINEKFHKEAATEWASKQDWEVLKDEFEKTDKANHFVYPTVRDFAQIQCAGDEDVARWIRKSIGPSPKKEIKWQGDWALERVVEKSKDLEHTLLLKEQAKEDGFLLQVALPVAGSYKSWIAEPDKIRQEVMKFLGGRIVEDRPEEFNSTKEEVEWERRQEKRLEFYNSWIERVETFKHKVDNHYLDALGMNKPNLIQSMFNLILNTTARGNLGYGPNGKELPNVDTEQGKERVAGQLAQKLMLMEVERSKIFDMPLPSEYQEAIVVGSKKADEEEIKTNGKSKKAVH